MSSENKQSMGEYEEARGRPTEEEMFGFVNRTGRAGSIPVRSMYDRSSIWVTRTGQMIRVGSMDSGHLVNVIHLLQAMHERKCFYALQIPAPNGEMAQDAWADELGAMAEAGPEFSFPIYDAMIEEAEARRLKFKPNYYERLAT